MSGECKEWSEDYHPCSFPYTGDECQTLFARINPDTFEVVQWFFISSYLLMTLIFMHRVVLALIDTGIIATTSHFWQAMPGYIHDSKFRRSTNRMNVYDYCNLCMLVTSMLQLINSCDLEAWSDRIPYKVQVTIGIIAQNMVVMTGIPVTEHWMNLIHKWKEPLANRNTDAPFARTFRYFAIATMWLVSFPITFSALFVTESCDNGCENGKLSCAGKSVYSVVLVIIVGLAMYYCVHMHKVLQSNDNFNWSGFILKNRASTVDESAGQGSPCNEANEEEKQKVIWKQINMIWKLVFFSVIVSFVVIGDNISYCSGHVDEIKYENPPCTPSKTIFRHKMSWVVLIGSAIFLLLIPYRQEKLSPSALRYLTERINRSSSQARL